MVLSEKYTLIRGETIRMCKPLNIEDYIPQPVIFVSPPKWVLGHVTWFFEELVLKQYNKNYREFHPKFNFLFNSYYNTVGDRTKRQNRGDLSRPTVNEVIQYRDYVDKHMMKLFESTTLTEDLIYVITLGLHHEQQHQELLYTDLKYSFSANPLYPAYSDQPLCEDKDDINQEFIKIKGGIYQIGFTGEGFCYDNELDPHQVLLPSFEISNSLVSNGEYLEFILDNGYDRFEFWHDEALSWLEANNIHKPMYWQEVDGVWFQYTLAGLRKIDPQHILAHITYYEAAAFAQWKGCRLPSEFEWEAACNEFRWGKRWEWTESAYLPYPGYKKAAGAVGEYNGKFMVNQKVLRGGSVATSDNHSRKSYRNFFHPHIGYQFNGIRLAK